MDKENSKTPDPITESRPVEYEVWQVGDALHIARKGVLNAESYGMKLWYDSDIIVDNKTGTVLKNRFGTVAG